MVIDGMKSIDHSAEADDFVAFWMEANNIADDSKKAIKIRDRTLPGLPDFALAFFKKLCHRNDIGFADNGRFNSIDYSGADGELFFPVYSKRNIEYDLRKLRIRLLENNIDDELINDSQAAGYFYRNEQGIGLSTVERKEFQTIMEIVKEIAKEAVKLKTSPLNKAVKSLQSYFGNVGQIDLSSIVSYEKDRSSGETHFAVLFDLVHKSKSCKLIRITNKEEKLEELIFPLFLRQTNNRWYLLYIQVDLASEIMEFAKNGVAEAVFDLCMMCPFDQILSVEEEVLKRPKVFSRIGQEYFENVYGAQRPRVENNILVEEVIFKINSGDPNAKFLQKRLDRERFFPNLESLNSVGTYARYSAKFFVTDDVINRILSYQPLLEIEKGDVVITRLMERVRGMENKYE